MKINCSTSVVLLPQNYAPLPCFRRYGKTKSHIKPPYTVLAQSKTMWSHARRHTPAGECGSLFALLVLHCSLWNGMICPCDSLCSSQLAIGQQWSSAGAIVSSVRQAGGIAAGQVRACLDNIKTTACSYVSVEMVRSWLSNSGQWPEWSECTT